MSWGFDAAAGAKERREGGVCAGVSTTALAAARACWGSYRVRTYLVGWVSIVSSGGKCEGNRTCLCWCTDVSLTDFKASRPHHRHFGQIAAQEPLQG